MKAGIEALGKYGLVQDIPGYSLPNGAVTSGNNFRTKNEALQSTEGYDDVEVIDLGASAIPCYHIAGSPDLGNTIYYNIFFGQTVWVAYDGTNQVDISPLVAPSTSIDYSHCSLNGNIIVSNNIEAPYFWDLDTINDFDFITGWNINSCKMIRSFKGYLFAFDIIKGGIRYPYRFKWSSQANTGIPTDWDETDPASGAGEIDLGDDTTRLIDGYPLQDVFVLYAENETYGVQFIGGQNVWRFYKMFFNHGILSANLAIPFQNRHFVVTKGDVIVHDGNTLKSVIDQRNREYLFNNISTTFFYNSFLMHHEAQDEVWICFPLQGQTYPNKALVWDYVDDTWSIRDLPAGTTHGVQSSEISATPLTWTTALMTWAQANFVWNQQLFNPSKKIVITSNTDGKVIKYDIGTENDNVVRESRIERTGINLPNSDGQVNLENIKCVTRIYPKLRGNPTIFEIGAAMVPEGAYIWKGPYTFDPATDYKIDTLVSGRYIGIRAYSNGLWRLSAVEFEYEEAGLR